MHAACGRAAWQLSWPLCLGLGKLSLAIDFNNWCPGALRRVVNALTAAEINRQETGFARDVLEFARSMLQ
jgi:hypothetical protein